MGGIASQCSRTLSAQIEAGCDILYAERAGVVDACREKGILAFGNVNDMNKEENGRASDRSSSGFARDTNKKAPAERSSKLEVRSSRQITVSKQSHQ